MYICICIYIYIYITQQRDIYEFIIELYFDSYKSSTDLQSNEKCKNYIQIGPLKKIKRTKSRLKRGIKCYKIKAKKFPMHK